MIINLNGFLSIANSDGKRYSYNMKKNWQKIKLFFSSFFTLNDTPHNIAGGLALGIFLGIIPGAGILAALFLATIFKLNKATATVGVLATNTWSIFIISPLAAMVGGFLFNINPSKLFENFQSTYYLGVKYFLNELIFFDLALPLIVGMLIVAGLFSLAIYFQLYFLLKYKKLKVI